MERVSPAIPAALAMGVPFLRARAPWWRRAARLAARQVFRWAENNDDPDMTRNGERWLLDAVVAAHARSGIPGPCVVIDGGANRGGYAREALAAGRRHGVDVVVYAFEPSPKAVEGLRAAFAGQDAVRIVAAALGAAAGEAVLHDGGSGSEHASLVRRDLGNGGTPADVTVPVTRLDVALRAQGVTQVHLLKLDLEGGELSALAGAGEYLDPARLPLIQFEYGGAVLDARGSLRDFYRLLLPRGYRVAKLFPNALELRDYAAWMDHFTYANYVAVPPPGA